MKKKSCLIFMITSGFLIHEVLNLEINLPRCRLYEDTYGRWLPSNQLNSSLLSHFAHRDPGQATEFTNVWLPHNCYYYRFTNSTIITASQMLVQSINQSAPVNNVSINVLFMGDSALRGIYCAICRIYAGSERTGPIGNSVCGSPFNREISIPFIHRKLDISFGSNLILSFMYVKSFYWKKLDELLEYAITTIRPYAIVFNTGAWDFYEISKRSKLNQTAPAYCHTEEQEKVSALRSSNFVNKTVWYLSELSGQYKVRLIYRNNHWNNRFGVYCADEKFEKLLTGTKWELWDNARMSEGIWVNQTFDGENCLISSLLKKCHQLLNDGAFNFKL